MAATSGNISRNISRNARGYVLFQRALYLGTDVIYGLQPEQWVYLLHLTLWVMGINRYVVMGGGGDAFAAAADVDADDDVMSCQHPAQLSHPIVKGWALECG